MILFKVILILIFICLVSYIVIGMTKRAMYNSKYRTKKGLYICKTCKKIPTQLFYNSTWWGVEYECGTCVGKKLKGARLDLTGKGKFKGQQ